MKIVLASQSPRRKQLLSEIIDDFIVCSSGVDESALDKEDPVAFVKLAAVLKAKDVAEQYPDDLIIGGDTAVIYEHHVLGKPKSRQEAFDTLKMLSGKTHQVLTGVCLYSKNADVYICKYEKTDVIFNELDTATINDYLDMDTYKDKAGSYAIQDIGKVFVSSIEGDYNNVVGFPVALVKSMLEIAGIKG